MNPITLTKKEAAERLRVSIRTVTRLMGAGKIRFAKPGGHVRIPQSEIDRLLSVGGAI